MANTPRVELFWMGWFFLSACPLFLAIVHIISTDVHIVSKSVQHQLPLAGLGAQALVMFLARDAILTPEKMVDVARPAIYLSAFITLFRLYRIGIICICIACALTMLHFPFHVSLPPPPSLTFVTLPSASSTSSVVRVPIIRRQTLVPFSH